MLERWQFLVVAALGLAALALVVLNATLFVANQGVQQEVAARQQYLQQTVGLEGLYREMVKALAELAVKNNDTQLLQMLSAQGINVTLPPAPAVPSSAVAVPKR